MLSFIVQICVQFETKSMGMAHKQGEGRSDGCQGELKSVNKSDKNILISRLPSGEMTMVLMVLTWTWRRELAAKRLMFSPE